MTSVLRPLVVAAVVATLATAAAAQQGPQAASYAIDLTHTFVTWEAKHFGTSTSRGRFDKKEGEITVDKAAGIAKADIRIDLASISTGTAPFDRHLRSPDFFDADKNPTARFVSAGFPIAGGKVAEVPGQLTLRGQTKPVTLKATGFSCYQNPMLKREVCGGDFETTIKRSEWGMAYGLPGIPDDVRLVVQVEAVAQ